MGKRELLIALNMIPMLGSIRIQDIANRFGDYEGFLEAKRDMLLEIPGINQKICDIILEFRLKVNPRDEIKKAAKLGAKIITFADLEYPVLLKNIYDPPPVIYVIGNLSVLQNDAVAIVGTRKATFYGKAVAEKLAKELAALEINVVSGMARGIDSYAHKGAIASGGPTTAVLGSGIDIIYPAENLKLAKKIRECGCLISSFPIGVKPLAANFPARNRVISGLSLGTLVVEAAEKSGSLITADFALEQGREVFSVPGSIMSPYSRGPHKLLKQGAKLVENVSDILEELNLNISTVYNNDIQDNIKKLSAEEIELLDLIDYQPVAIEKILVKTHKDTQKLNSILSLLEIKGFISILAGGYVVKK